MQIKYWILIFIITISACTLVAQKTSEVGFFFGRSYYLGEINPNNHYGNNIGSLTYGGVFRYNLNPRYSLKAAIVRTTLTAEDKNSDLLFNRLRDASFETKLTDFSGTIEFNFLKYEMGSKRYFFTPYLFTGFSVYKFNPEITLNNPNFKGVPEKGKTTVALPFGPGVKLNIGNRMSLALEWGFRKTNSDEIDGLPNRDNDLEIFEIGKPYDNDWYVVTGFMLTYRITDVGPCPYYGF